MWKIEAKLEGVTPLSFSRPIPDDGAKKDRQWEEEHWRERLHVDRGGQVFVPPNMLQLCLFNAAKYLSLKIPGKGQATFTKHMAAGIAISEPMPLGTDQSTGRPPASISKPLFVTAFVFEAVDFGALRSLPPRAAGSATVASSPPCIAASACNRQSSRGRRAGAAWSSRVTPG